MIPLGESIKKELDENSSFIKSEERESDLEFVFNEEKLKNDVIKSENSPMKKFDLHHKFMSLKNVSSLLNKVNKKGLKAHFESDEEEYFAQILTSKFPLLLLKKWSYKELKNFVDVSCLELKGGRLNVKSVSRKGDEVSRNERKKNRKNGCKNQSKAKLNLNLI
ncbi:UNVERIFIED_CONTAM: hypothetical protein RMT77_018183 [Armadillidium vulgare]